MAGQQAAGPEASPADAGDPLLQHLRGAEAAYREMTAAWTRQGAELATAREALVAAEGERARLVAEVDAGRRRLDQERAAAERQRRRAEVLAAALKDVHRALFSGNVYELILKACLTVTGGTRGLYIAAPAGGRAEGLRVRAAVDVDSYPRKQPSPFIAALCRAAIERNDTILWNEDDRDADNDGRADLPAPDDPAEQFRSCIAAPSVLLQNFSGVVIVADKADGPFDDDDVRTVLSVGDQAGVAVENTRLRREVQQAYVATVVALADAMEAKDAYTHGHCELVLHYARLVADRLGLPAYQGSVVYYAALLHDIGKIAVSDGILNKPGPLLPAERDLVRGHVQVGRDLLRHVPALNPVAEAILHHHEWFDGSGYPDGLAGEAIPLAARIICAVDAYCAMITKRSYKPALDAEEARGELVRCAGVQFDPRVIDAFLAVLDSPAGAASAEDDDFLAGTFPDLARLRAPEAGTVA